MPKVTPQEVKTLAKSIVELIAGLKKMFTKKKPEPVDSVELIKYRMWIECYADILGCEKDPEAVAVALVRILFKETKDANTTSAAND